MFNKKDFLKFWIQLGRFRTPVVFLLQPKAPLERSTFTFYPVDIVYQTGNSPTVTQMLNLKIFTSLPHHFIIHLL